MEHKMFNVYDQKARAYLPPFILPTPEMAIRTFADCCNSESHAFGQHPADYTLSEIAIYDDNSGELSPYTVPKVLGTGIEFVVPDPQLKFEGLSDGQPISDDAPVQSGAGGGNSA